jgi:hypothetical protein
MGSTALSMIVASLVTAGLAACGTDIITGQRALFADPGPSAHLLSGISTRQDVEGLLGTPFAAWKGVIAGNGLFAGSTFGVMPPGREATEWEYHAWRTQEIGNWPLERHRALSRQLSIVLDAEGFVRDVWLHEDVGQWTPKGLF